MRNQLIVIIPNWNGESMIATCIDSLLAQTQVCDILIVDNNSSDKSIEIIKSYGPAITLLEQKTNLGFTGGVNVGLRYAIKHGYLQAALLNNDAAADKNWIDSLLNASKKSPEAGIITSLSIRTGSELIDTAGEMFYTWGVSGSRGRDENLKNYNEPAYVFGASGGATMYSTKMLTHIGLFDEDFFMYGEDIDISFRAQLAGYKIFYEPSAIVLHKVNASSAKVPGLHVYHSMKNIPFVFWKNIPAALLIVMLPKFSIMYSISFLGYVRDGNGGKACQGVLKGMWLLPKKLLQRHRIQNNRTVTDAYIRSLLTDQLPNGTTQLRKILHKISSKKYAA